MNTLTVLKSNDFFLLSIVNDHITVIPFVIVIICNYNRYVLNNNTF